MTVKRLVEDYDDGYDDPYKQENTCIKCFSWTKGNVNGVCVSSAILAVVGIAVLISIASWAYVSMVTSTADPIRKTDRTKLFTDKGEFRYLKNNDAVSEYSADTTKNDNSLPEISSDPISLAPILPADMPDIPSIGSSAAVPDGPFSLSGVDSAPDKPYIIPAQPNDLNLDLIDDSPREGQSSNEIPPLGKSTESDTEGNIRTMQDRLIHKLEQEGIPKKSKYAEEAQSAGSRHNIHIIDLTSDDIPKSHSARVMQSSSELPVVGDKLPIMPSLVDIETPRHSNKNQDMNSIMPHVMSTNGRGGGKNHEIKKLEHIIDMEPPDIVPMTLYRIHTAAKSGSVCLDGSVPAYYHRPGIGSSERLWIIHFNGGAWCFDAKACFERAHSSLGSTNKLPAAPPIIQGINSPDPTVNPDFHDWNLVWVVYCDGASFTGDQDRPLISESGDTIYMRGKRVLNAIINDVLKNRNLKDAEALILTGSSAGSMTAIFQADYIASKLPKTIPVRVFSDAGFFIDTSSIGGKNLNEVFKDIYEMQNSSAGLHQDCIKDVGPKKGWQCFYPAKAVNYVKTPIFVLNSLYDIWALMYFIGINCKFPVVRQQERKKRSLYKNYMFPKDSELEAPELTEERSNSYYDLFYSRKKRDISGFEIFPFFRTPIYLEGEDSHATKKVIVDEPKDHAKPKTNATSSAKNISININVISDTPITNKNILPGPITNKNILPGPITNKNILPGPITNKVELRDVLSDLSNVSATTDNNSAIAHNNISPKVPHPPQFKVIKSMLNELKGKISDEQFSYLSANMAASLQSTIEKRQNIRKNIIMKASNETFNTTKRGPQVVEGIHSEMFEDPNKQTDEKNNGIIQSIRLKLLDFITRHQLHNETTEHAKVSSRDEIKRPAKRNKTRRSTSIAKEYINILRSDPPECTEKELLTAMLYRNLLIRATNNLIHNPKSSRFLISCINHSSSLFDDTWTTLKVGGKTIQQAFGDWFFERDDKGNYDLVDCPYPCNPTCP